MVLMLLKTTAFHVPDVKHGCYQDVVGDIDGEEADGTSEPRPRQHQQGHEDHQALLIPFDVQSSSSSLRASTSMDRLWLAWVSAKHGHTRVEKDSHNGGCARIYIDVSRLNSKLSSAQQARTRQKQTTSNQKLINSQTSGPIQGMAKIEKDAFQALYQGGPIPP